MDKDKTMTIKDINKRLREIEAITGDNEMAHYEEDDLHQAFIDYVAGLKKESPELAAKAELVLKTRDMDFERWYA